MANIIFTNTGTSIKVTFGDKLGTYGFKELEMSKKSTPLIVEEDDVNLSFYSNGDKIIIDFNDVETPPDTLSASDLKNKLSDLFFKDGLLIALYPPVHNTTYVKATSRFNATFEPWFVTDPAKLLTGTANENTWFSLNGNPSNQRFHIDLGGAKVITGVNYDNYHNSGSSGSTPVGAKSFTMWGSNTENDFADLVYANDGTWVQLATSVPQLDKHVDSDVADTKSFIVANTVAYRYYAFKFATNWGGSQNLGLRHIELLSLF